MFDGLFVHHAIHRGFASPFRSFFHRFFCSEAAALLPNMKEDVCLSAPVFLDTLDVSPKTIYPLCEKILNNLQGRLLSKDPIDR